MIFRYNYKSNDVYYSHNSFYKVYLTALKTAYNLWTFTWFEHFKLPFRLKGTDKIHTEGISKFHFNIYSILFVLKIAASNKNVLVKLQGYVSSNVSLVSFWLICITMWDPEIKCLGRSYLLPTPELTECSPLQREQGG